MKIGVIHTGTVTLHPIKKLFKQYIGAAEIINIIDDSLLSDAIKAGGLTKEVTGRITKYAMMCQEMGCDAVLNQCSSVSEAVDIALNCITIPYLKIDEPMAKNAVMLGKRIGLVATVSTTLGPSRRLIESKAKEIGKSIDVHEYLVDGALQYLIDTQDQEGHNEIVIDIIKKAATENDVVVMAQGSMAILLPLCIDLNVPVLASLDEGVKQFRLLK